MTLRLLAVAVCLTGATSTLAPSHPRTLAPSHPRALAPSHPRTLAPSHQNPLLNPADARFKAAAPEVCTVRLETSKGLIDIQVTRAWSPLGADRFVSLVRAGYYDDVRFFRVTTGRWTQFGINGTPAIAKAWRNQTIQDDPFKESNVRGTVAFAFAVPNGRTTQVFFNMQDNSATHDKEPFTPFGKIVTGMDVAVSLNNEYGEGPGGIRAGKQDPYFEGGNEWLMKQFPRLDYIKKATIK